MPTDTLDPTDQDTSAEEQAQQAQQQEQQRQQQSAQENQRKQQALDLLQKGETVRKINEGYKIFNAAGRGTKGLKAVGKWARGGMKTAGKAAATGGGAATAAEGAAETTAETAEGAEAAGGVIAFLSSPPGWVTIALLLLLVIVIAVLAFAMAGLGSKSSSDPTKPTETKPIPGLTMRMEGSDLVKNGENITYTIVVTYTGSEEIVITNIVPTNTDLITTTGNRMSGNIPKWALKDNTSGTSQEYRFSITLHPKDANSIVVNRAEANTTGGTPTGNIAILLPNPLPEETDGVRKAREQIQALMKQYPENIPIYQQAEAQTGVPWQVLAGKHFLEGGSSPTSSLVSGRRIGAVEPDIAPNRNGDSCSSARSGPGIPVPIGGGCGFTTLLDSAIYAGNHLKQKIGAAPQNFVDLVKALGRYNGTGNSNCDKSPYSNCPPAFESDDHPYPMNYFDSKHDTMYIIYCADLTRCATPRRFERPGVMAVVRGLL